MKPPLATEGLNDGQRAALNLTRDMLVSAGAGAGKTQVLGLRYLAIVEEGLANVPDIVAFTFTDKAAAEMRERVQGLLLARIEEARGDKPRLARLKQAQSEFARNRISTVHGFCHRLLRDYSWEAGLEPRAPILDERAQSLARERAIRRVLLQSNAAEQPALSAALVRLGTVTRLFTLTESLTRMLRERAFAKPPLHRAAELWANPDAEVARRRELYEAMLHEHLAATYAAVSSIDRGSAGGARAGDKLRELVESLQAASTAGDARALRELLLKKDGDPRAPGGAKGNWKHDLDALDRVRAQVLAAAAALAPAAEVLDFPFDEAFERRVGRVAGDLAIVFDAVCEAYEEECAGGLDFLDLELKALDLLRGDEGVRRDTIRAAKYLLVDEYQDTNPTQGELFSLITDDSDNPGRFFAVGDAKQSIYAFRGSDVRVFNRALDWIPRRNTKSGVAAKPLSPAWGLTCQDTPERRAGIIRLEHNYRTVSPVLDLGNRIFRNIFHRADYRDFDARPQDMIAGKQSPGATGHSPVEFHVLPDVNAYEEAEYVARQARRLRDKQVPLSNITILVRRSTRNALYRNAFARHDLPLLVVGEGGLFHTQEALDCVNLLRALANPGDNVAVLGVLRSPLAGLSDVFLTELALGSNRNEPLLKRLEDWAARPAHADTFLQRFQQLRRRAGRDAPSLLLGDALSGFGYLLAVGSSPDAEQRMANVARMLELVRAMQHELPSLAPLVRELRDRIDREEDETQGVPDSTVEGVRLMTIHKAKGLEFPIVILPDLGASISGGGRGLVRELPEEPGEPLGFYLRSLDDDDRGDFRSDFVAWRAKLAARERGLTEEKRALYVAWTRAAERILLVGSLKPGKPFDKDVWGHQLLRAMGIRDWNADCEHECVQMVWPDEVEPSEAAPHTMHIDSARAALSAGSLPLPASIDDSLVAPLPGPAGRATAADPEAVEFGTLVHAAMEDHLRGLEIGLANARVAGHVSRAREALATLGRAKHTHPEFGIMTPDGPRRLDLLRELDGDAFEIIDYKTDAVTTDLAQHAELAHGDQLRAYASALTGYLALRDRKPARIRLLVCFTAPDDLRPGERLVEITPK
ncbi:MAG: UvrD-helicase domain-containing protein [Planctomycetes bacterium]|nr:UvrD-helicase domain-containing protein [Planctomycetota bacterium]